MRKEISTAGAPTPVGHYSQGFYDGRYVFVSGQLGMDPPIGNIVEGGASAETLRALRNIEAIVKEAGGTIADVVKVSIFFANVEDWALINDAYASVFASHRPARSAVPVGRLPLGAVVEIEAIARVD